MVEYVNTDWGMELPVNEAYKKNLAECEIRIAKIYQSYLHEITPFIILIETIDEEYPSEILNELRAAFTHLARYYEFIGANVNIIEQESIERLEAQIGLAERHIKRCKLDCYKYACLSFADLLKQFDIDYKSVDLSYVEEGNFIRELHQTRKAAHSKYLEAKKADTQNFVSVSSTEEYDVRISDAKYDEYCRFICDADLYQMYEESYKLYDKCNNMIEAHISQINFLKKKASRKDIIAVGGLIVGVIGVLVGIIGIII